MIDPSQFHKLRKGSVYTFEYGREHNQVRGRLVYAMNRKHHIADDKGKITGTKIVPWRACFEPEVESFHTWHTGEQLRIYKVYLEAGMFIIHEV